MSQGITKLENLEELTNLREIYLDNNEIAKIENLENCAKLQKLWLHTNKIATIENIENLVELKELWLQANLITSVPTSITTLTNLEVLCLAENDVSSLKAIQVFL